MRSVNVLDLKFNARTIRRFRKPHKEIDVFVAIEEQVVIATSLIAYISYDVSSLLPF